MTETVHEFASDFPPASQETWEDLARAALKGADLTKLERRTLDDVVRGPLFTREDRDRAGPAAFIRDRDPERPWAMRQSHVIADPKAANDAILTDLSGGMSETRLIADRLTPETATAALDGVLLDLAPAHLAPAPEGVANARTLLGLLRETEADTAELKAGLGLSPVGMAALTGKGDDLDEAAAFAKDSLEEWPALTAFTISADIAHEAGATEAQEIAFAASEAAAYVRAMIDAGVDAEAGLGAIEICVAVDADLHLTIAKLRAVRRVQARIAEAFGAAPEHRQARIHAITSLRICGRRDPWPNLVRNACAGMGAAIGGADAITIRPATDAIGPSTRFSRHIARNLHILLAEEAHLGRAADPASGGFLHETLAARLADAGWRLFQEIEAAGGALKAIQSGWWDDKLKTAREQRLEALATGRTALIGVSQHPDPAPRPMEAESVTIPFAAPETETAFAPHRLAEPFEALWADADAFAATTKTRPQVFLATLGPLADFNARAGFATQRLAVGGVEAIAPESHESIEACADAFKASTAKLAVICGTDAAYGEHAEALAVALKQAGASEVWLAGRLDPVPEWVDRQIHMRSNALDDLNRAHAVLGVRR